jgi:hypothetical protein
MVVMALTKAELEEAELEEVEQVEEWDIETHKLFLQRDEKDVSQGGCRRCVCVCMCVYAFSKGNFHKQNSLQKIESFLQSNNRLSLSAPLCVASELRYWLPEKMTTTW